MGINCNRYERQVMLANLCKSGVLSESLELATNGQLSYIITESYESGKNVVLVWVDGRHLIKTVWNTKDFFDKT